MNREYRRVPTEFGPEARFEVRPATLAPFRAVQEEEFERLKARLLRERLDDLWELERHAWVRRAANDAAALAWVTQYPLLVFPALFEEKAEAALLHADRQDRVRLRTRELSAV